MRLSVGLDVGVRLALIACFTACFTAALLLHALLYMGVGLALIAGVAVCAEKKMAKMKHSDNAVNRFFFFQIDR